MYDNTQEDFEKKFPTNAANPATYLQRSLSAPAIAENVSVILVIFAQFFKSKCLGFGCNFTRLQL
jgi:hypothetical protein